MPRISYIKKIIKPRATDERTSRLHRLGTRANSPQASTLARMSHSIILPTAFTLPLWWTSFDQSTMLLITTHCVIKCTVWCNWKPSISLKRLLPALSENSGQHSAFEVSLAASQLFDQSVTFDAINSIQGTCKRMTVILTTIILSTQ
jgi:hypothetical protein